MLERLWQFVQSVGQTSIEVYEWPETEVRRKRLSNAPDIKTLARRRLDLTFSGWALAHGVVKADYLDRRNLMLPGLAFLLQAKGLIDVGKSPIQLRAGASKALNDVSSSSLAARVAQGLAILYGHHLGYKFAAHLSSHVQALPPGSPGAKHKDDAMADFLFANGSHSVIVESKGTFSLEENKPTAIKSVLKGALEKQVDPWMKHLQPAPSNGFVVYTCLREPSWVPSALFVVDPEESNDGTRAVPMSQDEIVRANYVGWLRAMGLVEAAARLGGQYLEPEHAAPEEIRFVTAMIEGRKYAFRDECYVRRNPGAKSI